MVPGSEVSITRVFKAPRSLVYRAWTDPELLRHWFSPRRCSLEIQRYDARPGGSYRLTVRDPEFGDCACWGVFLEAAAPERLVYTAEVEEGMRHPEWPVRTVVTVLFAEHQGKTEVSLRQTVSEALARETGALPSWHEMLDRLSEKLGG
jgi:uncharacterized protein YndB with AHSA1/START domain